MYEYDSKYKFQIEMIKLQSVNESYRSQSPCKKRRYNQKHDISHKAEGFLIFCRQCVSYRMISFIQENVNSQFFLHIFK